VNENTKSSELFFGCAAHDLHHSPGDYRRVGLEVSEYKPGLIANKIRDEFPVAVMGKFAMKNYLRYEEADNSATAVRYGLEPERLREHMQLAVQEVRDYVEPRGDEIMDAVHDAEIYELFTPQKGVRFIAGVQTRFSPKENALRSTFAFDKRFYDSALALRRREAELMAVDDEHISSPIYKIAQKSCVKTRRNLAKAVAVSMMPETSVRINLRVAEVLQN
jgi:hypothetical protein